MSVRAATGPVSQSERLKPIRLMALRGRMVVVGLMMLALLGVVAGYSIWQLGEQIREERQSQAKLVVQMAVNQINHIHALELIGALTTSEAQQQALDLVESTRYVNGTYLWVHTKDGDLLAHPSRPELVYQSMKGTMPAEAQRTFHWFNEQLGDKLGTIVSYEWPRPGEEAPIAKVSYIQRMQPWGWVVGSGVYIDDISAAQWHRGGIILSFGLLLSVLSAGSLYYLFRGVSRPVRLLDRQLGALAQGIILDAASRAQSVEELGPVGQSIGDVSDRLDIMRKRQIDHDVEVLKLSTALEIVREGIIFTDPEGKIIQVNRAFSQVTGYSYEEVIGKRPSLLSSGRHDADFYETMWSALRGQGQWCGEIWNRGKNGRVYPEVLTITAVKDAREDLIGYVGAFSDVTEGKRQNDKLQWFSEHDVLTGLLNRRTLEKKGAWFLRSALSGGQLAGVLYLDIDRFQTINETHGHVAGDKVLQTYARRLKDEMGGSVLIGRMGGDEFVCLMAPLASREQIHEKAQQLLMVLSEPVNLDGLTLNQTVSIGYVLAPDHATLLDDALRMTTQALTEAKGRGGNIAVEATPERPQGDYII